MNLSYFTDGLDKLPEVLIGVVLVYFLVIGYTKLFGLKSFSKMTSFDFAHTIAVGSLIASTIATGSPSVLLGAVLLLGLYALNYLVSYLQFKSDRLEQILENQPVFLMRNGEVLHENLRASIVTENELRSKLREANVLQLSQVRAVILETTGDVSVLHTSDLDGEIDDYILEGVRS